MRSWLRPIGRRRRPIKRLGGRPITSTCSISALSAPQSPDRRRDRSARPTRASASGCCFRAHGARTTASGVPAARSGRRSPCRRCAATAAGELRASLSGSRRPMDRQTIPIAPARYNRTIVDAEQAADASPRAAAPALCSGSARSTDLTPCQFGDLVLAVRRGFAPLPGRSEAYSPPYPMTMRPPPCCVPAGAGRHLRHRRRRAVAAARLLRCAGPGLDMPPPRISPHWMAYLIGSVGPLLRARGACRTAGCANRRFGAEVSRAFARAGRRRADAQEWQAVAGASCIGIDFIAQRCRSGAATIKPSHDRATDDRTATGPPPARARHHHRGGSVGIIAGIANVLAEANVNILDVSAVGDARVLHHDHDGRSRRIASAVRRVECAD